jgi:hypothetical protein
MWASVFWLGAGGAGHGELKIKNVKLKIASFLDFRLLQIRS